VAVCALTPVDRVHASGARVSLRPLMRCEHVAVEAVERALSKSGRDRLASPGAPTVVIFLGERHSSSSLRSASHPSSSPAPCGALATREGAPPPDTRRATRVSFCFGARRTASRRRERGRDHGDTRRNRPRCACRRSACARATTPPASPGAGGVAALLAVRRAVRERDELRNSVLGHVQSTPLSLICEWPGALEQPLLDRPRAARSRMLVRWVPTLALASTPLRRVCQTPSLLASRERARIVTWLN
jgi:hypothetical protein